MIDSWNYNKLVITLHEYKAIFVWLRNETTRTKRKQQMNGNRAIWLVYRTDTNARGFWLVKRMLIGIPSGSLCMIDSWNYNKLVITLHEYNYAICVWLWNENTRTKQKQQMNGNRVIWLVYRMDINGLGFWFFKRMLIGIPSGSLCGGEIELQNRAYRKTCH